MRLLLLLFTTVTLIPAQQPDLAAQSNRLQSLLQQIKPQQWPNANEAMNLLQAASKDNLAVPADLQSLSAHPDQIVLSLALLERLHHIQESVSILAASVARYQNPALAELILGIQTEGKPARDAFEERVLQSVADREEQFQVADHEAQRCRAILSRDPKAAVRSK